MDMEFIKKFATRKGIVGIAAIAAIGGAFGVVGTPAIIGISAVAGVYLGVQGLIDWQKEKNKDVD
jgi:hypothetical protein